MSILAEPPPPPQKKEKKNSLAPLDRGMSIMYIILSITFTSTEESLMSHSRGYNSKKFNICR